MDQNLYPRTNTYPLWTKYQPNLSYKTKVHEFDKGCGFAIATEDTAEEKTEQLGKATKAKIDPKN